MRRPTPLTDLQRRLFEVYKAHANEKDIVQLSRPDLVKLTGLTPQQIDNHRAALCDLGYVRKVGFSRPMRLKVLA